MNEAIAKLDRLVGELGGLGWLKTVRPADGHEDERLQREIDGLLESYPFLEKDSDYVAFLRRYAGALLVRDEDGFLLSFFGFSHDIGIHITEGPGDPVEDNCLIFCDMIVPIGEAKETCAVAYGFAATDDLRWGIYRFINGDEGGWCCQSFVEWLHLVIKTRGRLLD